jgi:hypothetical protein
MEGLMRIPVLALAACLWIAFPPHHAAARIVHYESIELVTADSDVMVRGTIVEVDHLEPERGYYYPYRSKLVIRVRETLKGPKSGEVNVALASFDPDKLDSWRKAKTELLFSLRLWIGPHAQCPFFLRPGLSIIELNDDGPAVVTLDLQELTIRADILTAARNGVAASPGGGEIKRLRLRLGPMTHPTIRANINSGVHIWVPVDQRLQERGEKWANSKSMDYRVLAPTALSPFKSEKNIAILKRLLADDFHSDVMHARDRGTRYYSARLPAYWVLKSWGVPVEKPVTEVPIRGPRDLDPADHTDFRTIDLSWTEGGISPSTAFSSRRSTPISMTPTVPLSLAER